MYKRFTVFILTCAVLALCLTACGSKPQISKTAVSLLEFPGAKWGMSPDEVKSAMQISPDMITEEKNYGDELRITISGSEYFGVDAESVAFRFLQYGDVTALWNVQVTYSTGTDMAAIRDNLIEIYGPGTDYGFTNYEIFDGAVQSYIDWNTLPIDTALKSIQFGASIEENAKNPKPSDTVNHRWAAATQRGQLFTDEEIETIVALFGSGKGTKADRETTLEYLDKSVWITILCRDGYSNKYGIAYRPCVSFTGSHIAFNQQAYQAANQ